MVNITRAVRQVKEDLARLLSRSFVEGICREVGHRWRDRVLDPFTTLHLFILQVLHGNTACNHVPHLSMQRFTSEAYCQARARLPLRLFESLVNQVRRRFDTAGGPHRWHGHRVVLIDGSSFSMPDTPALQKQFGQPGGQKPGCGFPVAHLLAVFDAGTGLILETMASPLRTHEMSEVNRIHPHLRSGDVLVGDRAFCSYAHLALILLHGLEAVFRMHQRIIVDFRPHRRCVQTKHDRALPRSRWWERLGVEDQLVEWPRPPQPPRWMSREMFEQLPESIPVRELRYRIRRPGFRTHQVTLATTLLDDDAYTASELAGLYHRRWQIETNLRHLKQTMGMDVLRCKTVEGVMKELLVFTLVYNLVRLVMLKAARRQGIDPDRISFIDALRWLRHARPGDPVRELRVNTLRRERIEPRAVKRRPKEYDRINQPRAELRKRWKQHQISLT